MLSLLRFLIKFIGSHTSGMLSLLLSVYSHKLYTLSFMPLKTISSVSAANVYALLNALKLSLPMLLFTEALMFLNSFILGIFIFIKLESCNSLTEKIVLSL